MYLYIKAYYSGINEPVFELSRDMSAEQFLEIREEINRILSINEQDN